MLKRIEVKNFKSLKHLDYKCAKLNLLAGLNGAGKSSFVQLLLLMRAVSRKWSEGKSYDLAHTEIASFGPYADLRYCYALPCEKVSFTAVFSHRKVSDVIGDMGQRRIYTEAAFDGFEDGKMAGFEITREITDRIEDKRSVSVDHPSFNALYQLDAFKEYEKFLNEHGGRDAIESKSVGADEVNYEMVQLRDLERHLRNSCIPIREEMEKSEKEPAKIFERHWNGMKMVDAFRIRPKDVHEGHYLSEKKLKRGETFDPEGGDVVEFLYKFGWIFRLGEDNPMLFPGKMDADAQYRNLINQVNFWLEVVSPGAVVKVDKTELGDEDRYLASVCFEEGTNGLSRAFKPQNVGFGISYILPVLVTLLTAKPEDIVIIENPEAHLHPKGQAKMGELLARAAAYGVQLFVETHSDHVINGVRVAVADRLIQPDDVNIAFFERKEHDVSRDDGSVEVETYAEVCNIKMDKRGFLSEYPEGFMDEWNNQLLELS